MKPWQKIALCGFTAAVMVLLVFAIYKAGLACANVNKRAALKIVDANGCIEFWLNRYQTLVAAGVSVVVAIFIVMTAIRQMRDVSFQTALAHRTQLAADIQAGLGVMGAAKQLQACISRFEAIYQRVDYRALTDAEQDFGGQFFNDQNTLRNGFAYSGQFPDEDHRPLTNARRNHAEAIRDLEYSIMINIPSGTPPDASARPLQQAFEEALKWNEKVREFQSRELDDLFAAKSKIDSMIQATS